MFKWRHGTETIWFNLFFEVPLFDVAFGMIWLRFGLDSGRSDLKFDGQVRDVLVCEVMRCARSFASPLHIDVFSSCVTVVSAGAAVDVEDDSGQTPAQIGAPVLRVCVRVSTVGEVRHIWLFPMI